MLADTEAVEGPRPVALGYVVSLGATLGDSSRIVLPKTGAPA